MENITVCLQHVPCSFNDCSSDHPDIKPCLAIIRFGEVSIGSIKLYTFNKAAMDVVGPNTFWDECQSYDKMHMEAKLEKVENFLANEAFEVTDEDKVLSAQAILFIDQVILEKAFRGRDFGLTGLRLAIDALHLPLKTIALLQAGAIGEHVSEDAGEKLARHWKRLGFREWSYTDGSWLLLSLEISEHFNDLPHSPVKRSGDLATPVMIEMANGAILTRN